MVVQPLEWLPVAGRQFASLPVVSHNDTCWAEMLFATDGMVAGRQFAGSFSQ
jgi:hypothetical protein